MNCSNMKSNRFLSSSLTLKPHERRLCKFWFGVHCAMSIGRKINTHRGMAYTWGADDDDVVVVSVFDTTTDPEGAVAFFKRVDSAAARGGDRAPEAEVVSLMARFLVYCALTGTPVPKWSA